METIIYEPDVSMLMVFDFVSSTPQRLSIMNRVCLSTTCVCVNYLCVCFRDVSVDSNSHRRRPRKQRLSDLLTQAGAHEGKHASLLHRQQHWPHLNHAE